jgi:AcrR family transcriptional regulator
MHGTPMNTGADRAERRAEKRRRQVAAAAKRLFLERSYSQVSIEEVAIAADLSKATVYKYFNNKLEIYLAVVSQDAKQLVEGIKSAFQLDKDISTNLRAMALAYVEFFLEYPEYFGKLSWFYLPGREELLGPETLEIADSMLRSARNSIERCLQMAVDKNELRQIDVKATAIVIYSQWLGLAYLAVAVGRERGKLRADYVALLNAATDQHLEGILARRK